MKSTVISISIAVLLIIGAFALAKNNSNGSLENGLPANNVSIENGVQIVQIRAKGGYQPRISNAKAGLPTILRFNTNGTFDCSASVIIPSLKISQFLATSGSTDIDLGLQSAGRLQGSCGMGMYPFEINFSN